MRWTESLIPTLKEDPQDAEVISHKLMVRGGFIRKLLSGAYSYLPLGFRVLLKIESIIRQEMNSKGAQEVLLPAIQPPELWKKTGRYDLLGSVLIKFRDRHNRELVLGPTHEEIITDLVASNVKSYKNLPLILYQIQTKFRDEPRPRFGVMRTSEFIMKDAYSFDCDAEGLEKSYIKMYDAYCRIYERCGLPYIPVKADPGIMGGKISHEFMVPSEAGEDTIVVCDKCGYAASSDFMATTKGDKCPSCSEDARIVRAIEVGHTFKLGTKYSEALGARFLDKDGSQRPAVMGCYGIGVNRIASTLIETSHDSNGIIWPVSIAPYAIVIIALNTEDVKVKALSEDIYTRLNGRGYDVLYDDRNESAGVKFKDSDLIGIPVKIIVGSKNAKNDIVELKLRSTGEVKLIKSEEIESCLKPII